MNMRPKRFNMTIVTRLNGIANKNNGFFNGGGASLLQASAISPKRWPQPLFSQMPNRNEGPSSAAGQGGRFGRFRQNLLASINPRVIVS
jgi:hypothetical protein